MYFEDPWILPSSSALVEGLEKTTMFMPLSIVEIVCQTIQCVTDDIDPTPPQTEELDHLAIPMWASNSSHYLVWLDTFL
jgi:hypothetical protein